MKTIFALVFLIFLGQNLTASPLIFKLTKEVTESGQVELCSVNTARYRQIRVAIRLPNGGNPFDAVNAASRVDIAKVGLNRAKRDFQREKESYESGVISKANLDLQEEILRQAEREYNDAVTATKNIQQVSRVNVFGFEENELFSLSSSTENYSTIIDTPPSQIKIRVSGKGTYKVFVWASL